MSTGLRSGGNGHYSIAWDTNPLCDDIDMEDSKYANVIKIDTKDSMWPEYGDETIVSLRVCKTHIKWMYHYAIYNKNAK